MSGFDSPAFRKNFAETKSQLKEFTVGAPEDDYNQPPQQLSAAEIEELRAARKVAQQSGERITDPAKKRIEILSNIGFASRDVPIDGLVFSIKTLKGKETRDATIASVNVFTNAEASFEIRRQTLARAIFKVDNQDLEFVLGKGDIDTRLSFIDGLEEIVITKLYMEFVDLRTEVKNKYGINTEKDAQEVVENLKK